ncbi:MAG: hypothetical protein J2P20_13175 [Pseudonocardia sp.]|nr:hypothetical protein [Pseudonocardia sp.]
MNVSTPSSPFGLTPTETKWASSLTIFAAAMLMIGGVWHALMGLAALFRDKAYVVTTSYTYYLDLTVWGWIFLLVGILAVATGLAVLAGKTWGRYVGIGLISLSMIVGFLFIPYSPLWSSIILVLDLAAIWALAVYQRDTL